MTTLRATCPMCEQPIDINPRDVVLHLVDSSMSTDNRYGFFCPDCDVFAVRPATPEIVDVLLQSNVSIATGPHAPWEITELPGMVLVESRMAAEMAATLRAPKLTEHEVDHFTTNLTNESIHAWLTD